MKKSDESTLRKRQIKMKMLQMMKERMMMKIMKFMMKKYRSLGGHPLPDGTCSARGAR